jgi:type IV secretory pathway TrbD component
MQRLVRYVLALVIIYLLAIAALEFAAYTYAGSRDETGLRMMQRLDRIENVLMSGANTAWAFAAPLLQLIVVLTVLEWFAERLGVSVRLQELGLTWNVQTLIALAVISSFCIAALAGLSGVGYLKDITLAVIGFYFGSRQAESQAREIGELRRQLGETPAPPASA